MLLTNYPTLNQLYKELESEGYSHLKEIPNWGLCGIRHFMFTSGLCYGLTNYCYEGRWCFKHHSDAVEALKNWDGNGDPEGDWIKHKGGKGEYSNPKNPDPFDEHYKK